MRQWYGVWVGEEAVALVTMALTHDHDVLSGTDRTTPHHTTPHHTTPNHTTPHHQAPHHHHQPLTTDH